MGFIREIVSVQFHYCSGNISALGRYMDVETMHRILTKSPHVLKTLVGQCFMKALPLIPFYRPVHISRLIGIG